VLTSFFLPLHTAANLHSLRSCDNLRKRQKDMLKLHDDIAELKCDMDSQTKPPKESKPQHA